MLLLNVSSLGLYCVSVSFCLKMRGWFLIGPAVDSLLTSGNTWVFCGDFVPSLLLTQTKTPFYMKTDTLGFTSVNTNSCTCGTVETSEPQHRGCWTRPTTCQAWMSKSGGARTRDEVIVEAVRGTARLVRRGRYIQVEQCQYTKW